MNVQFSMESLEPLVFGDGRPFSAAGGALRRDSFDLPMPSTLQAALAHALLDQPDQHFAVRGPLLECDGEVYFPVPLDGAPRLVGGNPVLSPMRPSGDKEGTDLPDGVSQGVTLRNPGTSTMRKAVSTRYVSFDSMVKWLTTDEPIADIPGPSPPEEPRFGVGIEPETLTAKHGMLYRSSGRRYSTVLVAEPGSIVTTKSELRLLADVQMRNGASVPSEVLIHLGGENRRAWLTKVEAAGQFTCPEEVQKAIGGQKRIRLILATPAQFEQGWLPSWLTSGDGEAPWTKMKFRLVAACVGRRVAVSGWSMRGKSKGPKPITWLAPAGSCYFLEAERELSEEDATKLASAWLRPVSDDSRFRRRGFGLALWGVW